MAPVTAHIKNPDASNLQSTQHCDSRNLRWRQQREGQPQHMRVGLFATKTAAGLLPEIDQTSWNLYMNCATVSLIAESRWTFL